MGKTKITWSDMVWNPTIGCTKISSGCTNCYAERMSARLKAMGRPEYKDVVDDKGHWTGKITLCPERLDQPLYWKKPRRIFVDSMSDLFHPALFGTDEADDLVNPINTPFLDRIFAVMAMAKQHTFQILTKREELMFWYMMDRNLPDRIDAGVEAICGEHGWCPTDLDWPLPNVWLGVSIEDQEMANKRVSRLLPISASIHFVSAEPLLSGIDFSEIVMPDGDHLGTSLFNHGCGAGIDWLIAGGESGPNARPMHPDWARGLRDQFKEAGVPFFFKQWGEWALKSDRLSSNDFGVLDPDGTWFHLCTGWNGRPIDPDTGEAYMVRVGRKKAGHLLDGQEYHEFPTVEDRQ